MQDLFHSRSRDQRNPSEIAPPSQGPFNSETACLLFGALARLRVRCSFTDSAPGENTKLG